MPSTLVPGSGSLNAKLMIIGEQPGRMEVMRRQCFTGPAGQNSDECMRAANINRSECYMTNVIKDFDAPISEYVRFEGAAAKRRGIITAKGQPYVEMLAKEIKSISPNCVVAYG